MEELVLDAYAARSCPVKTQNTFSPRLRATRAHDEGLAEQFLGGLEFQTRVLDELVRTCAGEVVDLRPLADAPWSQQEDACLSAMARGAEVIIAGVLPLDLAGHRSGRADLWVRGADQDDGRPGYHPVEIKAHRVHERRAPGRVPASVACSTLQRPAFADSMPVGSTSFRVASREGDLLQLAHYWRLLEAAQFAAGGAPRGGIIGTETERATGSALISWVALADKQIRTFSRTAAEGWRLRSPLERYAHEHAFRVRVAEHARRLVGAPDDPPALVRPIVIRECEHCPWWETCRPQLPDEDLSLRIDKSPLDVREISVLRSRGIATIDDLADTDLDALLPEYLPEVAHRPGAEERLRLAARRARLMARGIDLERTSSGPLTVASAPVEIDFDIETAANDRVYLWGFLVTDVAAGTREYVEFSAFEELDDESELALAREALTWLRGVAEQGRDVVVYHYSDYETVRLRRLAAAARHDASGDEHADGDEALDWAVEWSGEHFSDLFALVRSNFFGVHGLGLKVVATVGAGFQWRDDDPSGLNSQSWFDEAVHGESGEIRAAARRRVLEYNEDDCRATAALREWLRQLR